MLARWLLAGSWHRIVSDRRGTLDGRSAAGLGLVDRGVRERRAPRSRVRNQPAVPNGQVEKSASASPAAHLAHVRAPTNAVSANVRSSATQRHPAPPNDQRHRMTQRNRLTQRHPSNRMTQRNDVGTSAPEEPVTTLAPLFDALTAPGEGDPALLRALASVGQPSLDVSAPAALRPFAVAALAARAGRTVLAVTATGREADDLADTLASICGPDGVAVYPSWETLPHERLSPRADTVGRRLAVMRRLAHPGSTGARPLSVVVAPIRAVLQPQVAGLGEIEPVTLAKGDWADLDEVVAPIGGPGLPAGRPGRAARRVRGARGHPRHLPARPRSIRSGSSSSATRWRTSGRSPCPTSVRSPATTPSPRPAKASATGRVASSPRRCSLPRAGSCCSPKACGGGRRSCRDRIQNCSTCSTRSPTGRRSRAWKRCRRYWPSRWCCCSTRCRPGPTSWSATRNGSGRAPPSSSARVRSSWRRPGARLPSAARPRSTWAPPPTGRSPTCAKPPPRSACPGGR